MTACVDAIVTPPFLSVWVTSTCSERPPAMTSHSTAVPALRGIFLGHVTAVIARSGYDGAIVAPTCVAMRLLSSCDAAPAAPAAPAAGASSSAVAAAHTAISKPAARITRSRVGRCGLGSGVARRELERGRVHAVPLAGGTRAVVEHVPEVAAAPPAPNLGPRHAVRRVRHQLDGLGDQRLAEARPPRPGLELRGRVEQLGAACRTAVDAVVVAIPVLAGEGALGAGLPQHLELLGRELGLPLVVGLLDFVR